jgi:hypothetical protein
VRKQPEKAEGKASPALVTEPQRVAIDPAEKKEILASVPVRRQPAEEIPSPVPVPQTFRLPQRVYLYDLDSLQSMAERTLAVRKQESEKCHQLIEHHVQDFQLWIERTQSSNIPSMVVELPEA